MVRNEEISTIICKGVAEDMLNVLEIKEEQKARLENKIAEYKLQGVQPIIFAKRNLSRGEFMVYETEYMSVRLALTTTEKESHEFANKY